MEWRNKKTKTVDSRTHFYARELLLSFAVVITEIARNTAASPSTSRLCLSAVPLTPDCSSSTLHSVPGVRLAQYSIVSWHGTVSRVVGAGCSERVLLRPNDHQIVTGLWKLGGKGLWFPKRKQKISRTQKASRLPFTHSPLHDAWIADADIAQRGLISRKVDANWSCVEEHCIPTQHIAIIIHADHDTITCRLPVSTHICPIRLIPPQMGQGVIVRPTSAVSSVWRTRVRRCVGDGRYDQSLIAF